NFRVNYFKTGSVLRMNQHFGKTDTAAVDLDAVEVGAGGFVIDGQSSEDSSGVSVAGAGDVNGDGLADLIVGISDNSYFSDQAGKSYVVFGSTTGAFLQTAVDQLGTSGADTLSDHDTAQTLAAGAGNDSITATSASVLLGGAGDDSFILGSAMIAALQSPMGSGGNDTQLARIDGGSGIDTIVLSGSGLTFDLSLVANQGASTPGSSSRLEGIERIDITGTGDNELILTLADVLDMASMNSFNNANGWIDGTYDMAAGGANGANPEQRHQLVIDGNTSDAVTSSGWGPTVGTVAHDGHSYDVYNQGLYAQLLINTLINQTVF
ncbi:MAG: integrin alpha, partial [Pseudomonadota bacterium]